MTKPGFVENRMALWRAIMEKEFTKTVGDEGLFPNHSDKDIWMAGFEVGYNYYAAQQKSRKVKASKQSTSGTSFHNDTFRCTVGHLQGLLGEPTYDINSGDDKSNYEWICETSSGDVFTIYDWKYYRPLRENELVLWHIGAHNKPTSHMAVNELIQSLPE